MIKDIIHKFVFKKEREEAGVFDEVEEEETDELTIDEDNATAGTAESASKVTQHDNSNIIDGAAVAGSTSMMEISRATLIALLQRSPLQTVMIPLKLLGLLKWKEASTAADAAAAAPVASVILKAPSRAVLSSTSSSAPFERKFKKASIVIDAVNYSDDSEEDEFTAVERHEIVVQGSSLPLKKQKVTVDPSKKRAPSSPTNNAAKKTGDGEDNQETLMVQKKQQLQSSPSKTLATSSPSTAPPKNFRSRPESSSASPTSARTVMWCCDVCRVPFDALEKATVYENACIKQAGALKQQYAAMATSKEKLEGASRYHEACKQLREAAVLKNKEDAASRHKQARKKVQEAAVLKNEAAVSKKNQEVVTTNVSTATKEAVPEPTTKNLQRATSPTAAQVAVQQPQASTLKNEKLAAGPSATPLKKQKPASSPQQHQVSPSKKPTLATGPSATPLTKQKLASSPAEISPISASPPSAAGAIVANEAGVREKKQKEPVVQQQQKSSPSKKPTLARSPSATPLKKQKPGTSPAAAPAATSPTSAARSIAAKDGVREQKKNVVQQKQQQQQQQSSPSAKLTSATRSYSATLSRKQEPVSSPEASSPAATSSSPKKKNVAFSTSATPVTASPTAAPPAATSTIAADGKGRKRVTIKPTRLSLKQVAKSPAATSLAIGTSIAVDEDDNDEKERQTMVQHQHHEQASQLKVQAKLATSPPATPVKKQQVGSSPAAASPTTTNPSDDEHGQQLLQTPPSKKQKFATRSPATGTSPLAKKQKLPTGFPAAKKQKSPIDASPAASPPSKKQKLAPSSSAASPPKPSPIAATPSRRVTPLSIEKAPTRKAPLTPPPKVQRKSKDLIDSVNSSSPLLEDSSCLTVLGNQSKAAATPLASKKKAYAVAESVSRKDKVSPTQVKRQPLRKVEGTPVPSFNTATALASAMPATIAALKTAPNKTTMQKKLRSRHSPMPAAVAALKTAPNKRTAKKRQSTDGVGALEAITNKVKILQTKTTPKTAKLQSLTVSVEEISIEESASKSSPAAEEKSTIKKVKIRPKKIVAIPKTAVKLPCQPAVVEETSKTSESTFKSAPASKENSTNKTLKAVPKNTVAIIKTTAKVQSQPAVVYEASKKSESTERTKPISKVAPTANVNSTSTSKTLQQKAVGMQTNTKMTAIVEEMKKKPESNEQTKLTSKSTTEKDNSVNVSEVPQDKVVLLLPMTAILQAPTVANKMNKKPESKEQAKPVTESTATKETCPSMVLRKRALPMPTTQKLQAPPAKLLVQTVAEETPKTPDRNSKEQAKPTHGLPDTAKKPPNEVLQENVVATPTTPKLQTRYFVKGTPKRATRASKEQTILTSQSPAKKATLHAALPAASEVSEDTDESSEVESTKRSAASKSNSERKRKRKSYLMKQLEEHVAPGILSTCHKPKVFPGQLNLKRGRAQEVAGLLLEQLRDQLPEHAEEIPLEFRARASLKKQLPNCIVSPDRCERGYYKSHLDADFVNSFENSMPACIKIKSAVSKKGIAFISTTAATLSHTHYDQDTSFLLLLTGTKEIFYAPPSMGTLLRTDHPVISHSSNFEGISPFVELTGTSWRFAKLNAGDGLLLPQGWLHAVKSAPGTVAISFQIESAGMDATSPLFRRSRETAPEDIRHLSSIELEEEAKNYSSTPALEKKVGSANVTKQVVKKVAAATAAVASKLSPFVVKKGIANSQVILKNDLTTTAKPLGVSRSRSLATTSTKPVALKKGLATVPKPSGHEKVLSTTTKPDEFKKALRRGVAKPTRLRSDLPSENAPDRAESTLGSEFPEGGLPTREIECKKQPKKGLRRSSREKLICGVKGCGRDPATDASMWVLVLSMDLPDARAATTLPMVPTNHPKHLICMECCETRASSVISPEELLNQNDRAEIKGWNKYLYYSSSKVDYQKWANHAGENGKILQAF